MKLKKILMFLSILVCSSQLIEARFGFGIGFGGGWGGWGGYGWGRPWGGWGYGGYWGRPWGWGGYGWGPSFGVTIPIGGYRDYYYPSTRYIYVQQPQQQVRRRQSWQDERQKTYWMIMNDSDLPLRIEGPNQVVYLEPEEVAKVDHRGSFQFTAMPEDEGDGINMQTSKHYVRLYLNKEGNLTGKGQNQPFPVREDEELPKPRAKLESTEYDKKIEPPPTQKEKTPDSSKEEDTKTAAQAI